jgi:hypothetical protein
MLNIHLNMLNLEFDLINSIKTLIPPIFSNNPLSCKKFKRLKYQLIFILI